ncbi:MAG: hypothetical protein ACI88A_002764 [Paraglaciecola sp.]|jgi:hypothetical protein
MNSSISNSKQLSTEDMTSQKIFGKAFFAIGLSMLTAMVIIRLILISMGANTQGVLGRVTESRAALAHIVKDPDELAMFFGSSMTRAGFSPRQFDADLAELDKNVTSFNYGFGGLNPYFQDFLSRRIVEELEENERRLTLTMIEFNPFQTTTTRWNRAKPVLDSFLTLLASDPELLNIARQDITRGVRLFNIKYLRGNISAEMVTTFFGREIFPHQGAQKFQDDEETIAERRRLGQLLNEQFEKDYPNYKDSQWSYEWRGAGTIPEERSAETMALFDDYYSVSQTDALMKNDRLSRIRSADIEELHFEPLLVEHFINIIKNFQRVSDNLEVIMLPKNSKWIKTTPEADKRLAEVLRQIQQATGVRVKNHQDIPEIAPRMYRDTTHLSRYKGDVAYTEYLIKQYADMFE